MYHKKTKRKRKKRNPWGNGVGKLVVFWVEKQWIWQHEPLKSKELFFPTWTPPTPKLHTMPMNQIQVTNKEDLIFYIKVLPNLIFWSWFNF